MILTDLTVMIPKNVRASLERLERALSNAWTTDCKEHISDKTLKKVWDFADKARSEFFHVLEAAINSNRLDRIAAIIETVDNRCAAADGPVTPTLLEMTQAELSEIYALAKGEPR